MVLIVRCKNCGGKRALFDSLARYACTRCSSEELEVVVRDPFEEMPIPADVDERLDYGKIWKLARRVSPGICRRVMEEKDLPSGTARWRGGELLSGKKLSEGPDRSGMYGKRLAIFAAALCRAAGRKPKEERIWRVATHVGYRNFLLDQASSPRMKAALRLQNRQDLVKAVRIFWEG